MAALTVLVMSLLDALFGYAPAQVVHVAARLGIADHLARGPRSSSELAAATGTHEPSLRRLLRGLACLSGVSEDSPGVFSLTDDGAVLRSDAPDSIRRMVMLSVSDEVWRSWGELEYSVRTGKSAWEKVTGATSFAYFATHDEQRLTFNFAMSQHTRTVAPVFLAGYDFSRFATLVDLGGGNGTLISCLLRAVPGMKGVLFDTADGLESSSEVLAAAGVSDRCEVMVGDFFDSVPPGADAYVIKSVIHDWDDADTVRILSNCRRAMGPSGVLLVIEPVLPDVCSAEDTGAVMSDLNMLVLTEGRERTEAEFASLYEAAGLTLVELVGPLAGYRLIVGMVSSAEENMPRPSADGPVSVSIACSGCGISPTTRPFGEHTPAMSPMDPFGLPPEYRNTTRPAASSSSTVDRSAT